MPRVKKLKLAKVALCPRGMNQYAAITLYKSVDEYLDSGDTESSASKAYEDVMTPDDAMSTDANALDSMMLPLTTAARLAYQQFWQTWGQLWGAFCDSVYEMLEICEEDAARGTPFLLQSIDEFRARAEPLLGSLGLVEKAAPLWAVFAECETDIQKAGRVMSGARMAQLRAAITTLRQILAEAGGTLEKGADMAEDATMTKALEDRLAKAEAEVVRLTAQLAKAQQSPEDQEAEFLKSLPESVRKRWDADAIEKAALQEALKVEKDKRERSEYIEKTAAYRQAGIAPDDWDVLKALDTLDDAPRERVLTLLKALGAQVHASGLFQEVGAGSAGGVSGAAERLQALTIEKSASGNLTREQAYDAVLREHPDLYVQMRAEEAGR